MDLNPAKSIIDRLGGPDVVAGITGKHISRVYRWAYPKERGGTGGLVPQRDIPALLDFAQRNGIDLKHSDFFPAAEPAEAQP